MTLPTRKIGPFTVSAIGLGCMNLSHAYGMPPSEDDSIRLLNHALDAGVTFFDTAALYGAGANERLLGKAIMHRRREFTLASKCVLDMFDGKRGLDGRPEAIAKTLDAALQRLGTDHIDLYYLHRLDKNVPIEDSVGALVRAVEGGKIGAIGVSEMSAATVVCPLIAEEPPSDVSTDVGPLPNTLHREARSGALLSSIILIRPHRVSPLLVAGRVGAVGFRRVAVDQRPHEHRVRGAAHLVLDGEQMPAAIEVDDVAKAVLILVVLLRDQAALLQAMVGT